MNEAIAGTLSAVHCATRLISEGIAQLPCNLREHINERETRTAYGHPLQRILHDQPNEEMDSFAWHDMQTPLQVNWGDSFDEIQRDGDAIHALWPIHAGRVRVVRGPVRDEYGHTVGANGEIVYLIRSNDGTSYALEKQGVLHIPGVPSGNGINGIGLVRLAAETLGIVQATEQHVGSFYRNGATPDIVISFKQSVPVDEKQNLRESWSKKHAGVANAHKMLVVGGDAEVTPVSINPKDALLIDGRRFNISEVSRFWKVPPHMLYELGRATWANIEEQGTDFVTFTLGAWIRRREMAMKRQLLTREEQDRFSIKYNVLGLLRGNSAQRAAYYKTRFDLGTMSQDEIRENEDENPLPDGIGKRYYIAGNNYVPLDRIDDAATLNPGESADGPDQNGDDSEEAASKVAAAARAVQGALATTLMGLIGYESRAAIDKAEKPDFDKWVEKFYGGAFQTAFQSQIGPLLENARPFGVHVTLPKFSGRHIHESKSALLSLYGEMQDKPMRAFVERLKSMLDSWTARAATEAASAFDDSL